jgi:hypothetical protein
MPIVDPCENHPKAFRCHQCGWILGESYREDGKRITQLRTYRHPRPREDGLDTRDIGNGIKYSMMRVNDGTVACEHCGYCGDGNDWIANQTAIAEMLERRNARRANMDLLK